MKREQTQLREWDRTVDTLLPALVWLLGSQAWRALLGSFAEHPPTPALLVALLGVLVPAGLIASVARGHSPHRLAALLAAALAVARFVTAVVGPGAAVTYGWVGTGLVAAYLVLWPACAGERRTAGHGFLLGLGFQLVDVTLTGTLDSALRPGWGAVLWGWAAALPTLWLALSSARRDGGLDPESPLVLAMPLAFLAAGQGFAHLGRFAVELRWSVATTALFAGLGLFLGALLCGLSDQFLKAAFARRRHGRRLRFAYQAWRTFLAVAVLLGLIGFARWLAAPALLLAPTAVGVNLGALLRSRPIGLPRRLRLGLPLASWWLVLVLGLSARDALWPIALGFILLHVYASLALLHQERLDPTRERIEYWTLAGYLAVLGACIQAPLGDRPHAQPWRVEALRVAVVQSGGAPTDVARRLIALRRWHPELVLLLDSPPTEERLQPAPGLRFADSVYWLQAALDLHAYRAPAGRPALLARQPVERLGAPGNLELSGVWRLPDGRDLAAASLVTPGGASGALTAAVESVGVAYYWLLANPAADGVAPPAGYSDLTPAGSSVALWASPGIAAHSVEQPTDGLLCAVLALP